MYFLGLGWGRGGKNREMAIGVLYIGVLCARYITVRCARDSTTTIISVW